jgi:hypothetical protein
MSYMGKRDREMLAIQASVTEREVRVAARIKAHR